MIGRRELITLLGGSAAWPLSARAQQPARLPTIGYLGASTRSVESLRIAAFVERLRELGWIEGRTIAIDYRWTEGRDERAAEIAAELVGRNPDAVVTGGGNFLAQALQRVSKTVPIVMPDSDDPVEAGLVASLARPGGNITGFMGNTGPEFEAKRLELLKERKSVRA